MNIVKDKTIVVEKLGIFKDKIDNDLKNSSIGYSCQGLWESQGSTGEGVKRKHLAMFSNDRPLLEIGVPLSYKPDDRTGSIRGRIGIDDVTENYFLLRDPVGLTAQRDDQNQGPSISDCVKNKLESKLVKIEGRDYINICEINNFDIKSVIDVLDAVKSCKGWDSSPDSFPNIPGEITNPDTVTEGARQSVTVNKYERNPTARKTCIAEHGAICSVCGFDFEKRFGDLGAGYIHVHHLKPLAQCGGAYELNPVEDMRPVCPNCHAMLHRSDPVFTIEALKVIMEKEAKK